jgi:hypothetical protein
MTGFLATIPGADYSASSVGVIGPYTAVPNLRGLFDLRESHARARYNHGVFGGRPCLLNRAAPPTWTAGHVVTTAVGQLAFPEGPLHDADNTIFGIFEAHRAGGAIPQSPFGVSVSTSPNMRGQFLMANGPNFLRAYTYTRADPNNFLSAGTQRFASWQYPTNGSLDNQMIFAAAVIRNGVSIDLYVPGVNAAAPVGTLALTASDRVYFGSEPGQVNFHDLRYRTSAFIGSTERTRCFGYAHRALSLAEINQLRAELTAFYATKSLTFI